MAGWAQAMAVLAEVVLRMVLTESAVSAVNFQEAAAEMAPTAESRFVTPCRSSRRSHRCCQALGRSINASSPSLACAHNSGRSCCRQLHGPRPRRRAALEARECSHGRPSADRNLTSIIHQHPEIKQKHVSENGTDENGQRASDRTRLSPPPPVNSPVSRVYLVR